MSSICKFHLSPPKLSSPPKSSAPNDLLFSPLRSVTSPSIFNKLGSAKTSSPQSYSKGSILKDLHKIREPALTESFGDEAVKLSNGTSRRNLLSAISVGFVLAFMGFEEKAVALGPEGPLMEEFWDNMRRYGLYVLTVSSGALYTILQPILELLKNPLSALLIIVILGVSGFLGYQVLSAMVGISEFSYDYGN